MSRHVFETEYRGRPVTIVIGWDRPLQYHFMTVQRMDVTEDEAEFVYSNLDEPHGFRLSLAYYQSVLEQLGITAPASMFSQAEADKTNNAGNRFVSHQADGTMAEEGQETPAVLVGTVIELSAVAPEERPPLEANGFGAIRYHGKTVNVVRHFTNEGDAEFRITSICEPCFLNA